MVNVTFADAVSFEDGGGGSLGPGFALANGLFLTPSLPAEAMGIASNMLATPDVFVDAAANDYHLLEGAAPVDKGEALADVTTDRDGVPRPVGPAYDVGAYEWTDQPVGMGGGGGAGTGAGATGSGSGGTAGGASGDDGSCGCRLADGANRGAAEAVWLAAALTLARRSRRRSA
jgi:hypothetical protein